jgi:hypothetical protein
MKKDNLFVSVSGGETSWYMANLIKEKLSNKYNLLFGFANTGKERKETFDFNIRCSEYFEIDLHWIEAIVHYNKRKGCTHKIVNQTNYSKNGEPFEDVIKKYGLPNVAFPHCTRELKSNPLRSFAKEYFNGEKFKIAIGIRVDEIDRVSNNKNYLYPLVSLFPTMKTEINKFWKLMPFRLELKSYEGNCDLCFKKTLRKLLTVISEKKCNIDWWKEIEKKYEYYSANRDNSKVPFRFNRKNISVQELINMSYPYFEKAIDEKTNYGSRYKQSELFNLNLDVTNGCIESCEPF